MFKFLPFLSPLPAMGKLGEEGKTFNMFSFSPLHGRPLCRAAASLGACLAEQVPSQCKILSLQVLLLCKSHHCRGCSEDVGGRASTVSQLDGTGRNPQNLETPCFCLKTGNHTLIHCHFWFMPKVINNTEGEPSPFPPHLPSKQWPEHWAASDSLSGW